MLVSSLNAFSPLSRITKIMLWLSQSWCPQVLLFHKNLVYLETLLPKWLIAVLLKASFLLLLTALFLCIHSLKQYAALFFKFHINMKSKRIYLYIRVRFGVLHSVFGAIFRVRCFQSRLCPGDIVLMILSRGRKSS